MKKNTLQQMKQYILDRSFPEPNSGYWLWTGYVAEQTKSYKGGYGEGWGFGRKMKAHKISYLCFKGEVPKGKVLDNKCRVRSCVNPDHIEAVTQAENVRRGASIGNPRHFSRTKTHCYKGHEFSPDNTQINKLGHRVCLNCRKENWKKSNDQRRHRQ